MKKCYREIQKKLNDEIEKVKIKDKKCEMIWLKKWNRGVKKVKVTNVELRGPKQWNDVIEKV